MKDYHQLFTCFIKIELAKASIVFDIYPTNEQVHMLIYRYCHTGNV